MPNWSVDYLVDWLIHLKPRLYDTTGYQTGCTTGLITSYIHDTAVCQTGNRLNVCIHDTTAVVKQVVSCKRGFSVYTAGGWNVCMPHCPCPVGMGIGSWSRVFVCVCVGLHLHIAVLMVCCLLECVVLHAISQWLYCRPSRSADVFAVSSHKLTYLHTTLAA